MARKSEKTERFYEENNIERKKEWLKRYYHLTCDIADLRDEYERVSSLATSVTSAISKIRVKHSSEDKIQVAIEALSEIEEQIAEAANTSKDTVKRYIRLTYLLPELLQKVDEGQIAFTPAVHLSYLSPAEQGWVLDEMERNDCTPSVGQAYHLKEHSMAGTLTRDFVAGLMSQEKANQKERLKIPMERIRKYFPKHYTTAQMEDAIVKMCEAQFRRRTDRDAR